MSDTVMTVRCCQ